MKRKSIRWKKGLALVLGCSLLTVQTPVWAEEVFTAGEETVTFIDGEGTVEAAQETSYTQTENCVARVGDTYYDNLIEALKASCDEWGDLIAECVLLENVTLENDINDIAFGLNLNGKTISGDKTISILYEGDNYIKGPGTINGNLIEYAPRGIYAPLTVNGNVESAPQSMVRIFGEGLFEVTGNVTSDGFDGSISLNGDIKLHCSGTLSGTVIGGGTVIKEPFVTSVTMNPSTATLDCGSTTTLEAAVTPNDAHDKTVTWTSSETSVATVDANGTVTAVSPGVATITATAKNCIEDITATCTITVNALKEATPAATINYADEKLQNLTPEAKYTVNSSEYTADRDRNINIDSSWLGTTVSIIKKASDSNHSDSDVQSLSIPARPAAPSLSVKKASKPGANDGKITGLESAKVYQYSTDQTNWSDVSTNSTEITNLASNTYYVRVKASGSSFASAPATLDVGTRKEVEISGVTVDGVTDNNKTYDGKTVSYTGTPVATMDGAEVNISEYTYTWQKSDDTVLEGAPKDAGTYKLVIAVSENNGDYFGSTSIEFTIEKAENVPEAPDSVIHTPHSNTKVSDVALPENWSWKGADQELTAGEAVSATAVYNGADKENYKNVEVTVSIIRSNCEHGSTKVINKYSATCTSSGYTGDTYCNDCKEIISTGRVISPWGHSYDGGKVTKEPTLAEEGTKLFTCIRCGGTMTETIPKLTDSNGATSDEEGNITFPGKDTESTEDNVEIGKGTGNKPPVYDPETGTVITEEGNTVKLPGGGVLTPPAGSVVEPDGTVTAPDGTITKPDGTVIDPDGTVHNTDGSIVSDSGIYLRPATPMLLDAEIYGTGNQVKAILSGECAGAEGYDYVISKNVNCINDKDYLQVSKNILFTNTNFRYIPEGTYYVYCHAWLRGENGKKVFSKWSNYKMVEVTSVTPQTPEIKRVSVKGNTVAVTYTNCNDAAGYDIVLGGAAKKVNGEYRPVSYGNLVKKIKGQNTVTAVFRNVEKGTYYAGLHAWNRTSEDNKKVFSPWSDVEKVRVR